ncbi:MAG: endopeptidase La [Gammaproteobacteria bacterium]
MDYEQDERSQGAQNLVVASEVLPASIHILPQESRPFFPGQAIPLITSERWAATIEAADATDQKILGLVLARGELDEQVSRHDLHVVGTACRIHKVQRVDDQIQVLLEGLQRFRVVEWLKPKPTFLANVSYHLETRYQNVGEVKAYAVAIINTIKELLPLNPIYAEEFRAVLNHFNPNEPSQLADFAAALTTSTKDELQEILETTRIRTRLEKVLRLVHKELEVARSQDKIRRTVEEKVTERQREAILREQLKAIQQELGLSKDDRTAELEEFNGRLAALTVPEGAQKRLDDELKKLSVLETGSPEYAVTRNYLDWLTSLPWGVHSEDQFDLKHARKVLDDGHDALQDVKQRIIEFLGVGIMKGEISGSIILFVGPPGVGKTSLGRSIADALGRKFYRFSVGGMRDEAEIKGHRRTYIGAMPGKIVQALKECGTANPVIMLDEIDKIGASFRGDPASALLEVLDPEQNDKFLDHYLDVRTDLSKVLFVCTANQLDTIPGPLLDRMETIRLSGYLTSEKMGIARHHLLPRELRRAGLTTAQLKVNDSGLRRVIENYAREAGVRRLQKRLGTIARKAVIEILEGAKTPIRVGAKSVEKYLGLPTYQRERRLEGVGVVTGLAWTPMGGATLSIEATRSHQLSRGLKLTGQLGDVMRESADIAYSYVMGRTSRFDIADDYFDKSFIHLHVPAGATPKDGPSAGVTMATALISLARNRRLRRHVAMTGELTLTGHVLPVGGIREKVIAAKRNGVRTVVLPDDNRRDYELLLEHIRADLNVFFVTRYDQVFDLVFEG